MRAYRVLISRFDQRVCAYKRTAAAAAVAANIFFSDPGPGSAGLCPFAVGFYFWWVTRVGQDITARQSCIHNDL